MTTFDQLVHLKERGIDSFDLTTSMGKAMFGMLCVFTEFERDVIAERIRAGLRTAKLKSTKPRRRAARGGRDDELDH